jgi:RNA polymerase sigma-70 factor (ECF subfamily)
MANSLVFEDLVRRVRQGDSDAAAKLVKDYERAIRVAVRTRLSDPLLRRQFDSMDVCQSVLGSFFLRAASGQYDLREPAQLVALLVKMAQNKLRMRIRYSRRQCRDVKRTVPLTDDIESAHNGNGREHQLNGREMLDRAMQLMSAEVREMARRRSSGEAWGLIASELGGTADGRRKQFERAMNRIAKLLDAE